ncbi:MAG: hypothetical protein IKP52_06105 [Prevotella sp.]|nr:hypothetical protein [Prevotella sp.]
MSVHVIYYKDRAKMMRPVLTKEEYLTLRNSRRQQNTVKAVREGDASKKPRLLQMNYSCLPNDDGTLKGSTRMSNSVGMDIDHVPAKEMRKLKKRILQKKDELGLQMLEKSVRGAGYHLVFRRREDLSQEENLKWASELLGVKYDDGAKDITRVFFTTTASDDDLLFLSPSIFEIKEVEERSKAEDQSKVKGQRSKADCSDPLPPNLGGYEWRGVSIQKIIDARYAEKLPCAADTNRHAESLKLASDLLVMLDGDKALVQQIVEAQPWVQEIIAERNENVAGTVSSAAERMAANEKKYLTQSPSKVMQAAIKEATGKTYKELIDPAADCSDPLPPNLGGSEAQENIDRWLWRWGEEIEKMAEEFPIISDITKGLKRTQYPAALFVAGGLMMTLMTRCTYRFYHRPEELRRLNNSTLIIGDPASGKSFATRLYKQLMAPIVAADKVGKEAVNAYRELMRTKGANKEKPKKPKVVIRLHPARTSNAQFIQDMVNAVETVDGEQMQLHLFTFDTELDNTLTVQRGGSWIDKQSMQLKAFHNEEDGQAYSNNDSILDDFIVTWNYIYTGTPTALKKMVNEQNFGTGLATRLTCIPLPPTEFEMMDRVTRVDFDSDGRLKAWAFKLDKTKGELPLQKIVDELYDWTARRMMDAKENDSKADEMLLKRCAYHGLNFSAPFILMRHWDELKKDGDYWCGEFETDEVDWRLAELLVNIQYACQKHYFGALAENYFDNQMKDASVNVRRQQKTIEAFNRLPEEFTVEDVMRCFLVKTSGGARNRIVRLQKDKLIVKTNEFVENGTTKAKYKKTGIVMI